MTFSLITYRSWKQIFILFSAFLFLLGLCFLSLQISVIDETAVSHETILNSVMEEFLRRLPFVSIVIVILNLGFYFINNIVQKLVSMGILRTKLYFDLVSYLLLISVVFVVMFFFTFFLLNYLQNSKVEFPYVNISTILSLTFYSFYLCSFGGLITLIFWSRLKALCFFILYLATEYIYEYIVLVKFKNPEFNILPLASVRRLFFNYLSFTGTPIFSVISFALPIIYLLTIHIFIYLSLTKRSFPSI